MPLFKNKTLCPYCDFEFEEKPKRRRKCPQCQEWIYVREDKLYTEEGKYVYDWIKRLREFGASQKLFEVEKEELSKQFGHPASDSDTLWQIMNALVSKVNAQQLHLLYGKMVQFLKEEGKDYSGIVKEQKRIQAGLFEKEIIAQLKLQASLMQSLGLDTLQGSGFELLVRVNTCNDHLVCEACREAASRPYSLEEFIEEMPIPHNCTNLEVCRCWITFCAADDE